MGMSEDSTLAIRFHEGLCLAAGKQYARASAALLDCVVADPGCSEYVREFLDNLERLFPAGAQLPTPSDAQNAIQRAAADADWATVLEQGPHFLARQRGDVPTLLALASACEARGHREAEIQYFRAALQAGGEDVRLQRRAGLALARLCQFDEALDCWRRVEADDQDDEQAPQMIVALAVAKSRGKAGLSLGDDPAAQSASLPKRRRREPYKRFVVGSIEALALPPVHASGLPLTPIQQLEAAIRERPSMADLYLRLAQLYMEKDRDYDAERLLAKGRQAADRDARVERMWEDVTMLRDERQVAIAQQEVAAADNPQTRSALAQVTKERDRVEMEIFLGRCKREPDNAEHLVELGLRLERAAKLEEACRQFEKALADSDFCGPAALSLGRCLERLGDVPQALRHYRQAIEGGMAGEAGPLAGKLARRIKLGRLAERYEGLRTKD
jgi:tetratricopeptide (TPR) repeat protein